jgi:hypothetical protein
MVLRVVSVCVAVSSVDVGDNLSLASEFQRFPASSDPDTAHVSGCSARWISLTPGEQRPLGRRELRSTEVFIDLGKLAMQLVQGGDCRWNFRPTKTAARLDAIGAGLV